MHGRAHDDRSFDCRRQPLLDVLPYRLQQLVRYRWPPERDDDLGQVEDRHEGCEDGGQVTSRITDDIGHLAPFGDRTTDRWHARDGFEASTGPADAGRAVLDHDDVADLARSSVCSVVETAVEDEPQADAAIDLDHCEVVVRRGLSALGQGRGVRVVHDPHRQARLTGNASGEREIVPLQAGYFDDAAVLRHHARAADPDADHLDTALSEKLVGEALRRVERGFSDESVACPQVSRRRHPLTEPAACRPCRCG
jgi:hypothetical protein